MFSNLVIRMIVIVYNQRFSLLMLNFLSQQYYEGVWYADERLNQKTIARAKRKAHTLPPQNSLHLIEVFLFFCFSAFSPPLIIFLLALAHFHLDFSLIRKKNHSLITVYVSFVKTSPTPESPAIQFDGAVHEMVTFLRGAKEKTERKMVIINLMIGCWSK